MPAPTLRRAAAVAAVLASALAPRAAAAQCLYPTAGPVFTSPLLAAFDSEGGRFLARYSTQMLSDPGFWPFGTPTYCFTSLELTYSLPLATVLPWAILPFSSNLGPPYNTGEYPTVPIGGPGTGTGVSFDAGFHLLTGPTTGLGIEIYYEQPIPGLPTFASFAAVPEPATVVLTGGGLLALAAVARRRRAASTR